MKVIPAPPTTPTQTRAVRVAVCREDQKSDGAIFRTITEALFPPGGPAYNATYMETDNGIIPSPHNQADFLACLGYFYPKNFTQHRSDVGDRYGRLEPPEGKKGHFDLDTGVYWPEKLDLVPHKDRPFQFSFSGEAWDRGHCRYDVMIICTKNFDKFYGCPPIIFWPYYASSFFRRHLWPTLLPKVANVPAYDATQKAAILRSKNEFCAFIVSHCWSPVYNNNDIMARVIFFDFIAENYKQPSALGRCRRKAENNGRIAERWANPSAAGDLDPVVEAFRPFKFALVFENNAIPGYVTEKITNAILADTVPIYFGAPDIAEYISMDRIVHCELEGESMEAFRQLPKPKNLTAAEEMIRKGQTLLRDVMQPCFEEIKRFDTDPEEYLRKVSQPMLPNGQFEGSYFDLNRIVRGLRSVLSAYNSSLLDGRVV